MGSAGLGCLLEFAFLTWGPLPWIVAPEGSRELSDVLLTLQNSSLRALASSSLLLHEPLKTCLSRSLHAHFLIFYAYNNPDVHWQ